MTRDPNNKQLGPAVYKREPLAIRPEILAILAFLVLPLLVGAIGEWLMG